MAPIILRLGGTRRGLSGWSSAMEVYVSGVGMTRFGKSGKPLEALMAEAARLALKDARTSRVDAIYLGVMNAEEFVGDSNFATLLADVLELRGVPSTRVETASSTGAGAFETAFYAVASGHMKTALVIAGEKMTHLSTARTTRILSEVIDRSERRCGATMPALAAMVAMRYARECRLSLERFEDILARVAIKNHFNGSLNPRAQFQKAIEKRDYLNSPVVSYPLRVYDCAPISDGAAAIVVTSHPTPIRVAGIGHATDTSAISHRSSLISFSSTREAAEKAYKMAQVDPTDIHFAEVHDAFTPFEIIGTEDLGFFPPGEGWRAIEDGTTQLRGRLPINPSGGLKARGHPVGASGLAQLVEMVWQLKGEAGTERQLEKAEIGLAHSIGGLGNNNVVTILERTDRKKIMKPTGPLSLQKKVSPSRKYLPSLPEGVGILETFTVLHFPPEGFLSPLALGLVRQRNGETVMACNPNYRTPATLRIGQWVSLKRQEDIYVFEKSTWWNRMKKRVKRLSRSLY